MYDFIKIEEKWQEKWKKAKVFEPKINRKKKKFFFTTPYPYISGSLHIGHGRAVTESDVYVRYKRMKGFNVLYPLAFHITGTPVLGISAAIEAGDQSKINLYKSYVRNYVKDEKEVEKIVESFKEPWNIVNFFIPKMMDEYSSLGLSVDWSRRFTTGDPDYQKFITWQFLKYKEKGYLIKGNYPVLYCPRCGNAVGEDDIQDADTNPVSKLEFTLLKFKTEDDLFLVAGTLRPETVFGQTNLWVNPNIEYVKVKVGNEVWVMSREAKEKLDYQKKDLEIVGFLRGEDLIGKFVVAPGIKRKIIILPSSFVDPNVATGIVTSVPSDAPYDWMALKDLQSDRATCEKYGLDFEEIKKIKPIPIIRIPGWGDLAALRISEQLKLTNQHDPRLEEATQIIYKEGFHTGEMNENCGKYAGMKVKEAKELVKKELIEKGEADVMYETSRIAFCRDGTKIVVAILEDQWFLDFNAKGWKDLAYKCLSQMELLPENMRKLFEDTFEWLDKRPAARKRGLGTPLPFDRNWIIESLSDSTIYMSFYTIKNLINKYKIKPEQMIPEFFDYIYLGKGNVEKLSEKTKISIKALKALRESFDYWYPNDHRHTYVAHLSNHLSFFIFAHAGIFPEKYWPKKISFHGFVLSGGMKMSKSKGNVITLLDVKNKYGADTFRAYITSATNLEGTFDWKTEEAENIRKNLYNLYEMLSEAIEKRRPGKVGLLGKAFLSRFEKSIELADKALSEMRLRDYATLMIYTIPSWIKRLKRIAKEDELYAIYNHTVEKYIKMLSPLIPHMSEELWEKLGKRPFVSIQSWPKSEKDKINERCEVYDEFVERVTDDIRHVLKLVKFKPNKINVYLAHEWKYEFFSKLKEEVEKNKNVGELIKKLSANLDDKYKGEIAQIISSVVKNPSKIPSIILTQKEEFEVLNEVKEFLEREFGCEVSIEFAEKSESEKALKAIPGKPGIEALE